MNQRATNDLTQSLRRQRRLRLVALTAGLIVGFAISWLIANHAFQVQWAEIVAKERAGFNDAYDYKMQLRMYTATWALLGAAIGGMLSLWAVRSRTREWTSQRRPRERVTWLTIIGRVVASTAQSEPRSPSVK